MTEVTAINQTYSTMRTVTRQQAVIEKNAEDKFETVLFLPEGEARQGEGGLRTQGYFKQSQPDKPLITVVTVVFNGEKFLEETIQSVINQTYDNVEYIIIDGGSTDGTLDIIRKYERAIDYWVSEKDTGIYYAMNKGITLSTGCWVNFMNAGDRFFDSNVLNNIAFKEEPANSILAGNVVYDSGKFFTALSGSILMKNTIHHQGGFYPLSVFKRLGMYSLNYQILADYDFNLKCVANEFLLVKLNYCIAKCSDYGVSDIPKLANYNEEIRIRCHYLGSRVKCIVFASYSLIRYLSKRMIRWI